MEKRCLLMSYTVLKPFENSNVNLWKEKFWPDVDPYCLVGWVAQW